MTPEIERLLAEYATGTLNDADRQKLFAAALEDQSVFAALSEEQALKDVFDDPESRGYLLAELDRLSEPQQPALGPPPARAQMKLRSAAHSAEALSMPAPAQAPAPAPPVSARRFALPLAAVLSAIVITSWLWWRSQPTTTEVARNTPPAQSAPPAQEAAPVTPPPAPKAPLSKAPLSKAKAAQPQPAKADTDLAQQAETPAPAAVEREADAKEKVVAANEMRAEKKAEAPAPAVASAQRPGLAAGYLSRQAPTRPWRIERLENGRYVPTDGPFRAGDTITILLPATPRPQLTAVDGTPISLEKDGDWYRSAPLSLARGVHEYLPTTEQPSADRARQSAPAPRIRLTVD